MANLNHQQAIAEFTRSLRRQLSGDLIDIRLFGSVARGTETKESDIDILVLVSKDDKATRDIIIDITVDVNLNFDVVIAPVIMSKEHYSNPLFQKTGFYLSLEREGIAL